MVSVCGKQSVTIVSIHDHQHTWLTPALPRHPLLGPVAASSKQWIHRPLPRLEHAPSVSSVLGAQLLSESRSLSKLSIPEASLMDPPGITWLLETLNLEQPLCFL